MNNETEQHSKYAKYSELWKKNEKICIRKREMVPTVWPTYILLSIPIYDNNDIRRIMVYMTRNNSVWDYGSIW